jgi:hypothetical protein
MTQAAVSGRLLITLNASGDCAMATADPLPEGTDHITEEAAAPPSSRIVEEVGKLRGQAAEKAFAFANHGKDRASSALDELAKVVSDAAATVDDKVGSDYGDYARRAADAVSGAAATLREKDVEALYEDARAYVSKSPAIAVGAAIVIGFALARLARSAMPAAPAGRSGTE